MSVPSGRGASTRRTAVLLGIAGVVVVAGALLAPRLFADDDVPPPGDASPVSDAPSSERGSGPEGPGAVLLPDPVEVPAAARFATAVSSDGRYLVDQHGDPFLVRGDSPWSMLTDLLPDDAETYLATRADQGFDAVLVALLGATANGAPSDDGATVDGLVPFVDRDVTRLDEAYWARAHDVVMRAARHGITVFLYPVDGWSVGKAFASSSPEACGAYGRRVGEWAADLPNLVWVFGGDYAPQTDDLAAGSDVDHCMAAALDGLRAAGDERPASIQLSYFVSRSTDNPFWRDRVDWNFAYTYLPTYRAVLDAYGVAPVRPVLLGEANYEGENNQQDTPETTPETLRRQALWALTSGAAGDFFGTSDWELPDGWQDRLDSVGAREVNQARDVVAALRWWELVPDTAAGQRPLVVDGRGDAVPDDTPLDVLESDWVSAARTPDGAQAVAYVPTARTVTVDAGLLVDGVRATWVDPVTGAERPAGVGPSYAVPGTNADGDEDWLLVFRRPA